MKLLNPEYNIRHESRWSFTVIRSLSLSILIFCLAFHSYTVRAGDPVTGCRNVFSVSSGQWMVSALKESNPALFSCSSLQPSRPESRLKFDPGIQAAAAETKRLSELLENGDNCGTYIAMRSLCDLYFPLFEKKIKSRGLPEHYKYLPLLLSGLNQSHHTGDNRSGLWAMDFLAARAVKLRIDSLSDERRGGDFSTDAALSYLSYLRKSFGQDDAAVLLAYVYGNGFMNRLIRQSEAAKWRQSLGSEQRMFLLLYAYIVNKFESEETPNQMSTYFDILGQYQNMAFEQNVRYEALSKVLGVDRKVLESRNPVYTGEWISPSSRKVPFVLDLASAARFEMLKDSVYKWRPPAPVVSESLRQNSTFHKVKRGETLGGIAAKYHVSIAQLKKWNKIKGTTIYPGQRLKVRAANPPKELSTDEKKDSGKPEPKPAGDDSKSNSQAAPAEQPKPKAQNNVVTYTVKSGDTLWKIASKYKGVTPEEIMKWNNCSENIRPGQKLKIHLN